MDRTPYELTLCKNIEKNIVKIFNYIEKYIFFVTWRTYFVTWRTFLKINYIRFEASNHDKNAYKYVKWTNIVIFYKKSHFWKIVFKASVRYKMSVRHVTQVFWVLRAKKNVLEKIIDILRREAHWGYIKLCKVLPVLITSSGL